MTYLVGYGNCRHCEGLSCANGRGEHKRELLRPDATLSNNWKVVLLKPPAH
jgi:hypothetical protein